MVLLMTCVKDTVGVKVYATSGAGVSGWVLNLSEVLRTAFHAPRLNSGDLVTVLAKGEREVKSVGLIHLVQQAQPRPITAVVPVSLRETSL